jgi:hypothetical protein
MENPETRAIMNTRHRTKTNIAKDTEKLKDKQ